MKYVEERLTSADASRLFVRRFEVEDARGEVLLVHGFGEHSGRYGSITEYLNARHYNVSSYDHRGHGRSEGLPGHIEHFSDYEVDLDAVISWVRGFALDRRLFLIGHSMGGLVVLRYLATRNEHLAGALISAPLIGVASPVPAYKLLVARLSAKVIPRLRLDNGVDPAMLSRDPAVGRAYVADPLVNRRVSARWFFEATKAMEEVARYAARIKLPLLVMQGTQDHIASVEATERLFAQIGSADKELVLYPENYHELFNEPEKREIYERVTEWLNNH